MSPRHPGDYDLGYDIQRRVLVRLYPNDSRRIPRGFVRVLKLKQYKLQKEEWPKTPDGLPHLKYWSLPRIMP